MQFSDNVLFRQEASIKTWLSIHQKFPQINPEFHPYHNILILCYLCAFMSLLSFQQTQIIKSALTSRVMLFIERPRIFVRVFHGEGAELLPSAALLIDRSLWLPFYEPLWGQNKYVKNQRSVKCGESPWANCGGHMEKHEKNQWKCQLGIVSLYR